MTRAPATLRVVHVAQPVDGGVPRVVADLVADQAARGWDVLVACPQGSELRPAAAAAGARHLRWEARRSPGPSTAREARRLGALLRAAAPKLVHLHSAKAGLAGRLALRGTPPTVFQPHSWSFEAATGIQHTAAVRWERLGARWANAIVCVSEEERARGRARGIRGRWTVLPNGVDVRALTPAGPGERAAARAALGLPDRPLALVLGRLSEQKGQLDLVRLWPRVRDAVPDAELALVGDGPLRAAVAAAAGPGVRVAGASHDVPAWLAAADLLVAPSRWEAGSLAVMEAMARARSVVAYDAAGMRAAVAEGGAILEIGDEHGLADAIVRRLRDPDLAAAEGAAGRRRVVEHYDVTAACARMAALYGEVLERRTA